jgi:predicted glutamine amidotransferase
MGKVSVEEAREIFDILKYIKNNLNNKTYEKLVTNIINDDLNNFWNNIRYINTMRWRLDAKFLNSHTAKGYVAFDYNDAPNYYIKNNSERFGLYKRATKKGYYTASLPHGQFFDINIFEYYKITSAFHYIYGQKLSLKTTLRNL